MNAPSRPARQLCPLCSRDDLIHVEVIGPSLWRYTCANKRHPEASFSWQTTTAERLDEPSMEGKAADLGLYEDLSLCLVANEPFVEYGVVEHRYSELRPSVFRRLLDDYSHTRIQRYKPYTASVFIASALRKLADLGDVLYRVGPGTGHWAYNEMISYWALSGPREHEELMTWKQYAASRGIDPQT